MSSEGIRFKRMVVGLPHGAASQAAVEVAADMAEFLNIELLAAFLADSTLPALAELSGTREIGMLAPDWRMIDRAQIERDIEQAVAMARRRFAEGIGARAVKTSFDVFIGAEALAALIRADDIVVIVEPAHPAERIAWPFTALLAAAFATAGGVLVVPRRLVRRAGPIVTVASASDEPAVRAALEIAAAFKERLIVITAAEMPPSAAIITEAEQRGIRVEHVAAGARADVSQLIVAPTFGERLRVLAASMLAEDASRLLSLLHGIPLLVIGRC